MAEVKCTLHALSSGVSRLCLGPESSGWNLVAQPVWKATGQHQFAVLFLGGRGRMPKDKEGQRTMPFFNEHNHTQN